MPHGWAAAEYVLLHRNSLVYENQDNLELCWGVDPDWLRDGAHICVKNAPTTFGKVRFHLSRSGSTLTFEHNLDSAPGQQRPNQILLHIPASVGKEIRSVRLNGALVSLGTYDIANQPGQHVPTAKRRGISSRRRKCL